MIDLVAPTARFRIGIALLMIALGFGLQACAPAPVSQNQVEDQRADIRAMASDTLAQLYQQYPDARRQIQRAAGYAVFSNFGFKVLFMGSATGEGLAVSHATRRETFMRMVELQPGYGFGVQQFRLVFVFETPQAFDQFVDSGWEFGANAMASAQTRTQQMGSQLGVSVSPGVLMYQLSDQGAIVGVSITGAKYYPDPNLN
jgi:lipid-binding SYLF domain-containing protein